MGQLHIALGQINPTVGNISQNTQLIWKTAQIAKQAGADLIAFPELCMTGYPPEDLLFRPELFEQTEAALTWLSEHHPGIALIVGHPRRHADKTYNAASVLEPGKPPQTYYKQRLPNYAVFDEKRYFTPGDQPLIVSIQGIQLGIVICEDLWQEGPAQQAKEAGAECLISLNASPFHHHQAKLREKTLKKQAQRHKLPIAYVNLIGGQDELVFDGGSLFINEKGDLCERAPFFKPTICYGILNTTQAPQMIPHPLASKPGRIELVYQALVLGLSDYLKKNHIDRVVLGLSGGIDSALTLKIAVDAIGADHVHTLLMPSPYTAEISIVDAIALCNTLKVDHDIIPITPIFQSFNTALSPMFRGYSPDLTEENLQARIRGTLLMAHTNKKGGILLATSNKSELTVGFSTLYGDLCGGFAPIKDVHKTWVYELSRYCNQSQIIIPERIIERPPSAELAPDQRDEDRLPPYPILDRIIELFIEQDRSISDIIRLGLDEATVHRVIKLIKHSEYKRSQAPIGTRVTARAFGKDRRYPITQDLF